MRPLRTAMPEGHRSARRSAARRGAAAVAPAAVFAATFLFRWTTIDFDNDYFMHVSWAAEMLRGEWPVRDFVEPGFILQTLVAYVGLRLGGYQLVWDGAAASAFIAAGATFVYLACRLIGIPRLLAVCACLLAAAAYPRLYAYPKAFVYPAALWALSAYVARPTRGSLLLLSSVTAVAFLFRHDHALWIGIAACAGLLAVHRHDGRKALATAATFTAIALAFVSPSFAWVAASGHAAQYFDFLTGQSRGLVTNRIVPDRRFEIDSSMPLVALEPIAYPRIGIRWATDVAPDERRAREDRYGLEPLDTADRYRLLDVDADNVAALVSDPTVEDTSGIDRSTLRVPGGLFPWLSLKAQQYLPIVRVRALPGIVRESNAEPWLTYVTFALPWAVLTAVLARVVSRAPNSTHSAGTGAAAVPGVIVPAALLSLLTYQTLVRGSPDSRLGDVASMTGLLLAWLAWQSASMPRWLRTVARPLAAVMLGITLAAAIAYGQGVSRLAAAGVDGPTNAARRVRDVASRYAQRPLDVFAPPGTGGLPGLARWTNECTAPHERIGVIGFEPQVFVMAERGFAGGMAFFDLGWASSDADQLLTLQRWARQDVPIVLAMASEWQGFAEDYPRVRAWIDERFHMAARSAFGGGKEVIVLTDRSRAPASKHGATGLPCYANDESF